MPREVQLRPRLVRHRHGDLKEGYRIGDDLPLPYLDERLVDADKRTT